MEGNVFASGLYADLCVVSHSDAKSKCSVALRCDVNLYCRTIMRLYTAQFVRNGVRTYTGRTLSSEQSPNLQGIAAASPRHAAGTFVPGACLKHAGGVPAAKEKGCTRQP